VPGFSDRDCEGCRSACGPAEPGKAPSSGHAGDCRAARGGRGGISVLFTAGQVAKGLINFLLVVAGAVMFLLAQGRGPVADIQAHRSPAALAVHAVLSWVPRGGRYERSGGRLGRCELSGLVGAVMTGPAYLSCFGAFVTFGRGALRGRVRRAFWRNPPMWLDQELQRSATWDRSAVTGRC
jgi:hypothetical protein